MADRFQKLFSLENNLYIENSPIVISAAALLKDTKSGNIVVQIKFKSVSKKNIKGVKISLHAYDVSGKEINGVDDYQYLDLNIPNGQSFGSSKAIVMPETTTRSFDIKSLTVIFADSSIWEIASPDFVAIPNAKPLNCELENEEIIKQYQIVTTNKANYIPNTFLNLWTCCCGEVNSEKYCTNCGTNKNDTFTKYNITDLTEAMNLRLDKEKEEQLESERQAEIERIANAKKKRKIKTTIAIGMPIFAILIGFMIILNLVIVPNNNYKKATIHFQNGNYQSALELFLSLEDYKDSFEMAEKAQKNMKIEAIYTSNVGDSVKFGNYKQTRDGDIKEIEWYVIKKESNKVMLISKYCLDAKAFYDYTPATYGWEYSSIRSWLNYTFYNDAFDSEEKSLILSSTLQNSNNSFGYGKNNDTTDKVFLLSVSEARNLLEPLNLLEAETTKYFKTLNSNSFYFLRTVGKFETDNNFTKYNIALVVGNSIHEEGLCGKNLGDDFNGKCAIRPVVWIDLDKIKITIR